MDLISVALVCEDGREFYAENADFDWESVRLLAANPDPRVSETPRWLLDNVLDHLAGPALSVTDIRGGILELVGDDARPQFWGWYSDYDWVAFAWIFGRMADLPAHFPRFCRELRQAIEKTGIHAKSITLDGDEHHALADARWARAVHRAILNAA